MADFAQRKPASGKATGKPAKKILTNEAATVAKAAKPGSSIGVDRPLVLETFSAPLRRSRTAERDQAAAEGGALDQLMETIDNQLDQIERLQGRRA